MNIGFEDGEYLAHYGTKGQKWGVRRYQNEDGSLTEEGKKRYGNSVFISGTTKTSEDGTYKRDKLPTKITDKIDEYIGSGRKILVGDAPGIDSQIQDYLSNKNYKNVEVFVSGDEVRKLAGGKLGWTVNKIDGENFEKYSKEWRAVKDKAMNAVASEGLAVVIKDGSGATRKNIDRFIKAGKAVMVYQLDNEDFVDPMLNQKEYEKMKHDDLIEKGSEFLAHYGIKGQKRGIRRYQNEDGSLTPEGYRHYGIDPNGRDSLPKPNWEQKPTNKQIERVKRAVKDSGLRTKPLSPEEEKRRQDDLRNGKINKDFGFNFGNKKDNTNDSREISNLQELLKTKEDFSKLRETDPELIFLIDLEIEEMLDPSKHNIDNETRIKVLESFIKSYDDMSYEEYLKLPESEREKVKGWQDDLDWLKYGYEHSDLIISGEEFLAHYGIKGQQWGQRRFQNEDGTLTPEGRKRYGLKSDYSSMTNKELIDEINKIRTKNQYLDLMTADTRKKKEEIKSFTRTAFDTAGKATNVYDRTVRDNNRAYADKIIKESNEKMSNMMNSAGSKAEKEAVRNSQDYINAQTNKNMAQEVKDGLNKIDKALDATFEAGGKYAPNIISKGAYERQLQEEIATAYRNIEELDSEQLKKTVDRMLLEKQYDELINPPKPSKIERGREALQTIGTILAITGATIGIIKEFKGRSTKQSEDDGEYLVHYGIKGQKRGVRRFQNEDGSLTPEGYRRYGVDPNARQATDPREILARQRAQEQARSRQIKSERRQARYTQKFAERQALREARTQARIQSIYDRQALAARRQEMAEANKAAAENRRDIRQNIVKGIASVATIGAALYVGRHFLNQRALDNQHIRDIEKINEQNKANIKEIREKAKTVQYKSETERMLGLKEKGTERYKAETERLFKKETEATERYKVKTKAETERLFNKKISDLEKQKYEQKIKEIGLQNELAKYKADEERRKIQNEKRKKTREENKKKQGTISNIAKYILNGEFFGKATPVKKEK